MVRELPEDGNRYECIDGQLLVTPSPVNLHQSLVGAFYRTIFPYVEEMRLGYVQISPLDVELDEGMVVQPDILAFRLSPSIRAGRIHGRDFLLTVEVLSPSTARRDRGLKRAFYARISVAEYWIVHPESRLVERWRAGAPEAAWEDAVMAWHPEGVSHALTIDLPALFDAVPEMFRGE